MVVGGGEEDEKQDPHNCPGQGRVLTGIEGGDRHDGQTIDIKNIVPVGTLCMGDRERRQSGGEGVELRLASGTLREC